MEESGAILFKKVAGGYNMYGDDRINEYEYEDYEEEEKPKRKKKPWIPLESDPEIFSSYQKALGFPKTHYKWHEVFSLESWVWHALLPQPILAAILCYEVKDGHRQF